MHHQVAGECVHTLEADIVAVLDECGLIRGVLHRCLDEREVHRAVVVQNQEPVTAADARVFDRVLDPVASREHGGELGVRVGGVGDEHLGCHRGTGSDDDVGVAAGAPDADPESLIRFVEHLLATVTGSEAVAPHGVRPPGGVHGGVVDGGVVDRPRDTAADTGDLVGVQLTGS